MDSNLDGSMPSSGKRGEKRFDHPGLEPIPDPRSACREQTGARVGSQGRSNPSQNLSACLAPTLLDEQEVCSIDPGNTGYRRLGQTGVLAQLPDLSADPAGSLRCPPVRVDLQPGTTEGAHVRSEAGVAYLSIIRRASQSRFVAADAADRPVRRRSVTSGHVRALIRYSVGDTWLLCKESVTVGHGWARWGMCRGRDPRARAPQPRAAQPSRAISV